MRVESASMIVVEIAGIMFVTVLPFRLFDCILQVMALPVGHLGVRHSSHSRMKE
jgi:hypothetical protein